MWRRCDICMSKWQIENPVLYSPSSGETVSTAWQKQIAIDTDLMDFINRVRTMDASAGSNITDSEAFQFKVNTTNKTLLIRNATNSAWITCGYLDKEYFGITPEVIYAVKNNGGVNSIEAVTQEPVGGSNGNIAIDTENKKLYQRINGVWTLLLSLSASDMLDYTNLIKNNGGDIGKISIVNTAPTGGANGDIAIDITNKRMYQKNSDTWNMIFSLRASDLSDYDSLITQEDVSTTAEADKIPRADSTGKLPNNIAGSPDKLADKQIISTDLSDGTSPVYRNAANGFVFESVSPGSVINDGEESISNTYSSSKIQDLLDTLKSQLKQEIRDDILQNDVYAVGKLYISQTDSRNPNEILGFGTWEQLAAGHTLVSAGNVSTNNYSHNFVAGETGGEFVHQLSVGEIASHSHSGSVSWNGNHNHSIYRAGNGGSNWTGIAGSPSNEFAGNYYTTTTGNHNHTVTISNTGSNQPHNNIQPYVAANIWIRIS